MKKQTLLSQWKKKTKSFIFSQYANLLSRRTDGNAVGKYLFSNRNLLLAFAFSISCILLIVYVPTFNRIFHTSHLNAADWILPLAAGAMCLGIFEFRKKIPERISRHERTEKELVSNKEPR